MNRWSKTLGAMGAGIAAAALMQAATLSFANEIDFARLLNAHTTPQDWLMYRGTYRSWHYSSLDQVNIQNVKNLKVAWMHTPGASRRGVQSFPLVADGVLYYSTSMNQIWALDAATGKFIWKYQHKLDESTLTDLLYSPYNRGVALGYGKVFFGTIDGHAVALDMKTGKKVWDVTLVDIKKTKFGFTGAPLVVKDFVVFGSTGGELAGCCGPIFAVNQADGAKKWQFDTIGGDERSRASWGNDSWKTGGGGGWMTGSYDHETNTIWWGTANPAPDYDWAGDKWRTEGARPGENLYTSGLIVLDADSGALKTYWQEMPHDAWDFDGAVGESVIFERDGKKYVLHPNKGGHVFVYERDVSKDPLKIANVWHLGKTANYVKRIDPKTGELIGRRELPEGKHKGVCPAIDGAISWNAGTLNPRTGMYYKVGQEWCFDIEVVKIPNPGQTGQAYFGANWTTMHPPGRKAFGHVSGRDPISGTIIWEREYEFPPLASLLSTGGNLLFVPRADGIFEALDARNGQVLWSHNNGLGHHGGIITYSVGGKQYVAVVTGWGSHVSGNYAPLFGEPFTSMPTDGGQLIVFSL